MPRLMRVDLHIHTRYSSDALTSPQGLVRRCQEVGLDCIAVTDHNTMKGALEVQRLASFPVILGEEIKTTEGELIGLFLKEPIPKRLTPVETARRIKEQGGLVVIPHPFDGFRRSAMRDPRVLETVLPYVDIVEAFNARTMRRYREKAAGFAREHKLAVSAVSDAHSPLELGRTYVEMEPFKTPQEFKEALARGRLVTVPTTVFIHVLTTLTKVARRLRMIR